MESLSQNILQLLAGDITLIPEALRLLEQADLDDICKRLLVYAAWRAKFYGWLDSDNNLLPGHDFTIDDIVQEAITLALGGKRNWDPSKSSLFTWLKYQVDSIMDAWIKSASGQHEIAFADDETPESNGDMVTPRLDDVPDDKKGSPEAILIVKQASQKQEEVLSRVYQAIVDDPELVELFDVIIKIGDSRPRILADTIKTDTSDINNRKKRWIRRISEINSNLKGQSDE